MKRFGCTLLPGCAPCEPGRWPRARGNAPTRCWQLRGEAPAGPAGIGPLAATPAPSSPHPGLGAGRSHGEQRRKKGPPALQPCGCCSHRSEDPPFSPPLAIAARAPRQLCPNPMTLRLRRLAIKSPFAKAVKSARNSVQKGKKERERKEKICCLGLVGDFPREGGLGIPILRETRLPRTSPERFRVRVEEVGRGSSEGAGGAVPTVLPGVCPQPGTCPAARPRGKRPGGTPGKPLSSAPALALPAWCV